jgi:hypothetical protein
MQIDKGMQKKGPELKCFSVGLSPHKESVCKSLIEYIGAIPIERCFKVFIYKLAAPQIFTNIGYM